VPQTSQTIRPEAYSPSATDAPTGKSSFFGVGVRSSGGSFRLSGFLWMMMMMRLCSFSEDKHTVEGAQTLGAGEGEYGKRTLPPF
jgi:hypothetical protein